MVVNRKTEPSAGFGCREGIRSTKGGHFEKSCELSWAYGKFLANQGLPELLKYFPEASDNPIIPDRTLKGSIVPHDPYLNSCAGHSPGECLADQRISPTPASLLPDLSISYSTFFLSMMRPAYTLEASGSPGLDGRGHWAGEAFVIVAGHPSPSVNFSEGEGPQLSSGSRLSDLLQHAR